jgi:peptidoglycan/xylan/chitin deacetylase (PgdA/CDA1 family)
MKHDMDGIARNTKPGRRWRPAPSIRFSFGLHVAGIVALFAQPALWPWVAGMLIANHLLLSVAVLFPRASILGPNLTRLPAAAAARGEIALTFDDGPDPQVTPQVLDALDRFQAKASFFCVGAKAAAAPEIVREIVRRGHSVENHSHHHPNAFAFYGVTRLGREVDAAQAAIGIAGGRPPHFFRAPAGFRSPMLDPVLAWRGLRYMSWTRRGFDTVRRDPARVLASMTRDLAGGDILLLHDAPHTRTDTGEPLILAVLPQLLAAIAAKGLKPVALSTAFDDGSSGHAAL